MLKVSLNATFFKRQILKDNIIVEEGCMVLPILRKGMLLVLLTFLIMQLSGCGETVHGIGEDARRIGKGVKTIFIRDAE